jgi:serine/threonine protein kinase
MMKDIGYHRNIVSILGCCTLRQPYCLVVEHMPHGDLLAYFRNIRNKMEKVSVFAICFMSAFGPL